MCAIRGEEEEEEKSSPCSNLKATEASLALKSFFRLPPFVLLLISEFYYC